MHIACATFDLYYTSSSIMEGPEAAATPTAVDDPAKRKQEKNSNVETHRVAVKIGPREDAK
jgi:hypothetical protein